jgi:NodT family efflux transporter outer membrane factor (OMF) lipoprotein
VTTADRWWTAFADPGLDEIMAATFIDNLSLRMAWSRLEQMQAVARMAGAGRLPAADLVISGERQKYGEPVAAPYGPGNETADSVFAGLTVAYQVDLWQKVSNSRKAALYDLETSRLDVEATAFALSGAAGELWYGIASEQASLALLSEQLAVSEDFLRLVELRFANGLASAVEVFQQRLQVESIRNQIPATASRLAVNEHQLAVLLGREPRAALPRPVRELPALPPLPTTGAPVELLRARPDVRAAELQLVAADHRLAVAVADRYPSLSFSASVGGQAESFSNLLDQWFLNLAGSLLAPLFDGGLRAAEVERNRALVEERFTAWQAAVLGACSEVEDALATEHGLLRTEEILATQLELAKLSLQRSRSLYANGLSDYLSVLTSLQALQELERRQISTRQQALTNRIRLHLALGGSWSRELEQAKESS